MAEIRIEKLHKAFGDFVAVRESDLTIAEGEFFALLGPSGCGKTTTLRMIAGLEMPSSGRVLLGGEDVTRLRAGKRDIAFVFQMFALYPHLNVRDNIAYPLRSQGVRRREVRRRVDEVARTLRIGHLLHRKVSALPGGDRQRVALARAMIRTPRAFLMDEPLGTLDAEMRHTMREELRGLHDRIGATTVYVTHDQVEAMSMADRIAVMRDGLVLQAGPPQEIYSRPATMFVAGFVGAPAMNFLPARGRLVPGSQRLRVADAEIAIPTLREGVAGEKAVVGVRPEHLRLSDQAPLRGVVDAVEYLGSHQLVVVNTEVGRVRLRTHHRDRVTAGERVGLEPTAERLVVFDPDSQRALASAVHPGGPPAEVLHG